MIYIDMRMPICDYQHGDEVVHARATTLLPGAQVLMGTWPTVRLHLALCPRTESLFHYKRWKQWYGVLDLTLGSILSREAKRKRYSVILRSDTRQ